MRTYLVTYGAHYESLSLAHVCEMFSMEEVPARRIISRMIFNKEIAGAWDYPADTIALYSVEASPLQALSQQMADKIAQLVESNERLIDPLVNFNYGYQDNWGGRGGDTRRSGGGDQDRRKFAAWKSQNKPQQGGGRGRGRGGGRGGGGRGSWSSRPNLGGGGRGEASTRTSWGAS